MSNDKKLSLQDLTREEMDFIKDMGHPSFRIDQVYLASLGNKEYEQMNNIPKILREQLEQNYYATAVKIKEVFASKDGTEKYLFLLNDGNIVEGVYMPHNYGNTLCISTQVGCRMGCVFCASTLNGLIRNLTAGEMLGQVLSVNARQGGDLKNRAISNIVLMGSGEPLDNFDNVKKFLRMVTDSKGFDIGARKVSLSTCGLCDKIIELADMDLQVTLTISLHASSDEMRSSIMPINKSNNIAKLISSAKYYFNKTKRRIIFEYALIDGENTGVMEAFNLARLLKGLPCHVNLINLNYVKERNLKGASKDTIKEFMDTLDENNISNTLRRSMGNDIEGACGQLRNKYIEEEH